MSHICGNNVCGSFKARFPKSETSPVQSDHYDTRAELEMRPDGAIRSLQHLFDIGFTEPAVT